MQGSLRQTFLLVFLCALGGAGSLFGQGAIRLYQEAEDHFLLNEYPLAEEKVRLSLRIENKYPDAWFLLGQCRLYQNDLKGALKYYDKALKLTPSNPEYYYHKGLAYEQQGKTSKAVRAWSRTTKLSPNHGLAWKRIGSTFYKAGDFRSAIDNFSHAIDANTTDQEAYMLRGGAQSQLENHQEAITDYTWALELDERNLDAYFNRANSYAADGQLIKAVQDYTLVVEGRPADTEARLSRAVVLLAMGLHDVALTDLDTVILLDSTAAMAYQHRAFLLHELEKWDAAALSATKACELQPTASGNWLLLGRIEFRRRKYQRAVDAYDNCLLLDKKQAEAYLNRGEAKRVLGDEPGACKDWKKVIKLDDGELAKKAAQWHEIVCE